MTLQLLEDFLLGELLLAALRVRDDEGCGFGAVLQQVLVLDLPELVRSTT